MDRESASGSSLNTLNTNLSEGLRLVKTVNPPLVTSRYKEKMA